MTTTMTVTKNRFAFHKAVSASRESITLRRELTTYDDEDFVIFEYTGSGHGDPDYQTTSQSDYAERINQNFHRIVAYVRPDFSVSIP